MTLESGGDMIQQYWRNINTGSALVCVTGQSSRAQILPFHLLSVQETSVRYVTDITC